MTQQPFALPSIVFIYSVSAGARIIPSRCRIQVHKPPTSMCGVFAIPAYGRKPGQIPIRLRFRCEMHPGGLAKTSCARALTQAGAPFSARIANATPVLWCFDGGAHRGIMVENKRETNRNNRQCKSDHRLRAATAPWEGTWDNVDDRSNHDAGCASRIDPCRSARMYAQYVRGCALPVDGEYNTVAEAAAENFVSRARNSTLQDSAAPAVAFSERGCGVTAPSSADGPL